ncbi:MAG: tetratricopeptide repeat protein [Xanthobacteraceae bacterium]|nr:tetratricopeptide repeat protein [Xanthobacteraceae bacterium]
MQEALLLHRQGALADAALRYSQVMRREPRNVDAVFLLALILTQQGQVAEAQKLLRKAVKLAPTHGLAHNLLGATLKESGQFDEALRSFKRALTYKPDLFEAYTQAARLLIERGEPGEALAIHDRALAANPGRPEPWINRGLALHAIGHLDDAVGSFDHALAMKSDFFEALFNRGNALAALGRHEEAVASFDAAIAAKPDLAVPFVNRGNSLLKLARREEALASYEKAALLQNDLPAAHFGRALTLEEMGRFQDAAAVFDHMLTLPMVRGNATFTARLHARRAAILIELGRTEEARADADAALGLAPDDDEVLYHVSNLDLLVGNWRDGWARFEHRLALGVGVPEGFKPPPFPRWTGAPLGNDLLILRGEQGIGDRIQFANFAAHLAKLGNRIVIWTNPASASLLRTVPGIERVITDLAEIDASGGARWLELMSLPHVLGTTPETVPNNGPYISADPTRVAQWRERLGSAGFKVGITWQGSTEFRLDRTRSLPLAVLAPLAEIAGVRLISLQKGLGEEQIGEVAFADRIETLGAHFDEDGGAFADTAAAMMSLDLVVCPNTAISHLAGALGRDVFLALPRAGDWRWLLGRDDTPWYPTMRLFRQTTSGDWSDVIAHMAQAIRERATPK